jgi:predicted GIY-YIG superfamily endonuclease
MTKSWTVYMLECADQTLYTGITNDLTRRLAEHNAGKGAKYTRGRTPLKLVYSEDCEDRGTALQREMQIKALSRAKKRALIGKV